MSLHVDSNEGKVTRITEVTKAQLKGLLTHAVAEALQTPGIDEILTVDPQRASDRQAGFVDGRISGMREVLGLILPPENQKEIGDIFEPLLDRIAPVSDPSK